MAERSDYLLEIGTEELPAGFLETCAGELQDKAREVLEKSLLTHGEIEILQTPRRLALLIHNLSHTQASFDETLKGPPASVALDAQGKPTQAGLGFARKMGVDFSELKLEDFDGTGYLVCHRHAQGRPVQDVLPEILPDVVLSLTGSHFMVWDESQIKFSRPIRWLVSLLGDQHLPIRIGLVESSKSTRGHRFFSESPTFEISNTAEYRRILWQKGHVMVDQAERRQFILNGLAEQGNVLNGTVPPNEDLLDTVTMLVESPSLIAGTFEERFLSLPKEVITTVMAAHQKYFPVESASQTLLPTFITISNNTASDAVETIRQGNEKVLRARLEDASFFFQEDIRQPLSAYAEQLRGITFQKGLGTLYDKTERVKRLTVTLAKLMGYAPRQIEQAERAAELCKADLATGMVRELTELQGVMGRHYARLCGEPDAVAEAIAEHYQPRFMGDSVATSPEGIALSLADKLDTLLAVFAQKEARYPTGSKDPMGLRRMALGVLQTLLENDVSLSLNEAIGLACQNLGSLAQESQADAVERTRQFLIQRFKGYLLEQQYSYDAIDAVLDAETSPFKSLTNGIARLALLKNLQKNPDALKALYEPANRTARILGKAYQPDVIAEQIEPACFEDEAEKALYQAIVSGKADIRYPKVYLDMLEGWGPVVDSFFDKVLVNVDNAKVKENRYRLLSLLNKAYRQFADFTKLVV